MKTVPATLYDVPAPAKLNLFLHVVGRRGDGYHELQTVFRFVDLCDRLSFERRGDGRIVCENSMPGLAPQDDLVVRAAQALQRATGTTQGAQIACDKRIPSGGGLGGGSSDAAATLIALNRLWGTGLSRAELMRLALPLGADVPVFVFGRPAFAEGIGEILTEVALAPRAYLIVQPAQAVPTQGIFSAPDLTRNTPSLKITVFADWQRQWQKQQKQQGQEESRRGETLTDPSQARQQARDSGEPGYLYFGRNDLEPVVFARYPKVRQAQAWLARQGIQARMTGSGACLFAEFVTLDDAMLNQQKIVGKMTYCASKESAVISNAWACPGLMDHPLRHWTHD